MFRFVFWDPPVFFSSFYITSFYVLFDNQAFLKIQSCNDDTDVY